MCFHMQHAISMWFFRECWMQGDDDQSSGWRQGCFGEIPAPPGHKNGWEVGGWLQPFPLYVIIMWQVATGTICEALCLTRMVRGVCHSLSAAVANLHSAPFATSHEARWEVIAKEGKACLSSLICGRRRQQAIVGERDYQLNAFNKNLPPITKTGGVGERKGFRRLSLLNRLRQFVCICVHVSVPPNESFLFCTRAALSKQMYSEYLSLLCLLGTIFLLMYDSENWETPLITLSKFKNPRGPLDCSIKIYFPFRLLLHLERTK